MSETVLAVILIVLGTLVIAFSIVLIVTRPGRKKKKDKARQPSDPQLRQNEVEVRVGARRAIVSHAQHIGMRASQQDAYGFTAAGQSLVIALCDGMGGMAMGEEAARLATEVLLDVSVRASGGPGAALAEAMNAANDAVYQLCQGRGGTTAVLAWLDESGLSYAAAGDSRIYLYRGGVLHQLGIDHVLFYDLVRSGAASPAQAGAHPEHDHLTSYLGRELLTRVNATDMPLTLLPGDGVLLISDGINKTVDEAQLTRILQEGGNAAGIAAAALFAQNPHQDNLTCVLVRILG